MKIAVSSYSFTTCFKRGMAQAECIPIAKEMGFDAIEFSNVLPPEGIKQSDYASVLAGECKKVNLPIVGLNFGADFLNCEDLPQEIQRVKEMIDIADILGAKIIRHDATSGDGRPFEAVLPILADACREITKYAASKGIKTTVENHGFFCQESARIEKLYSNVNHDNFGILLDIGNFLCADELPESAVGRLAPYAFHVHAKDFHIKSGALPDPGRGFFMTRGGNYLRGSIIGHGNVAVLACLKSLKKAGYDGYASIEFEGLEEPLTALPICLENLRRYVDGAF